MQDQWFTFHMFDAQTHYARDVMLGKIVLPDHAEMVRLHAEARAAEEAVTGPGGLWHRQDRESDVADIWFQADYVLALAAQTEFASQLGRKDIEGVVRLMQKWQDTKTLERDIRGYRDRCHRSINTLTMAPPPKTPFFENFDESVEAYCS